MMCYWKSEGCQ